MKNITKIFFGIFALILFNACQKNDSVQLDLSRVNFIHASPDVPTGNLAYLFVNNTLLNQTGLAYRAARGYNSVISGNVNFKGGFAPSSPTSYSAVTERMNINANIIPQKSYSLFFTGLNGSSTSTPPYSALSEAILVEDNLVTPTPGSFKIRVANMLTNVSSTPTTIKVEVRNTNGDTVGVIDNVTAKSVSSFITIPLTTTGYTFHYYVGGSNTAYTGVTQAYTGPSQTLVPGRIYTLMLSGFEAVPTGAPNNGRRATLITNL